MKKINCFLLVATIIIGLWTSCNFSKGMKIEALTGVSYSYNGLSLEGVKLFDNNMNTPIKNSKEIKIGRTLYIKIGKVTGFTVENKKIFPGCDLVVTDPDGNIVLEMEDMYPDAAGYDAKSDVFTLNVIMGNPIVAGKEYTTKIHLYDKKKTSNELNVTVNSEVVS